MLLDNVLDFVKDNSGVQSHCCTICDLSSTGVDRLHTVLPKSQLWSSIILLCDLCRTFVAQLRTGLRELQFLCAGTLLGDLGLMQYMCSLSKYCTARIVVQ